MIREKAGELKYSDYFKKKRIRENRKRIVSAIAAIVVFVTTYSLILPAITLDVSRAGREPGVAFEQMQFRATASAASVTAVDSAAEEVQVEEDSAEEPTEEETVEEDTIGDSEGKSSAASDNQEQEEAAAVSEREEDQETPAESDPEEEPAAETRETEEIRGDEGSGSKTDAASSSMSESSHAQTADPQKETDRSTADQAAVDRSGAGMTDDASAASEETSPEFQIPALDAIDFDDILTGETAFYYYHPENTDEAESLSSDSIDDWKKAGSDTVLAPQDFLRVYLSYEIPAGALNETNAEVRYRLPDVLQLSDRQIQTINGYENGIAASKSGSEHDKYLGAEAIEGSRTPDEKAGDEYISATVKVEKTNDDRQELVFTFIPYTIEKNQISYDATGKLTSEGRNVKGFFTFDLTTSQIDFENTEKETVEKEDGTTEEIQYSEADVVFVKENNDKNIDEISSTLTMAVPVEKDEPQEQEQKTLISKGANNDYTVTVSYTDDAQIPDNAELAVREIEKDTDEYASYLEQAKGAVDENKSVNEARFFDITIVADGEKIEPQAPVNVQITFTGIEQTNSDDTQLLHYKDDKEVEVMDQAEFSKSEEPENETKAVDTVQFETDGFSVYGIVGTGTITVPFVAGDGRTYEVTVTYGEDAGIPAGSTLAVSELREESEEYQNYLEQTADAVGTAADALNYIKILDISIMNGEEKVVIQAPVDVQIKLLDKDHAEGSAGEKTKVVHFGESETEVINPDLNGKTVNFEAAGFSYYAVTTYGATSDLAGKSYAIVWVKTVPTESDRRRKNHNYYRGRALATDAWNNNTTRLDGVTVTVETHESGRNLVTGDTAPIVEWKFESAEAPDTYYIKAPNGRYLNLKDDDSLELSDTKQALTVTAGTGDYEGKVRISHGARRVQSSMDAATTAAVNDNQYFYNGDSNEAGQVYLTLCEVDEFSIGSQEYSGEKISVQNLEDRKKYLIYRTIYNETRNKYEEWIIDGNGNPVRAYDQGDSLSLYSDISPMWTVDILKDAGGQPTGYYIFRNEATGMILHPLADGTLVREYDAATSPATDGVSLKGREGGAYTSTIEYWDESAMTYYGYRFTTEDGVVDLKTGTGDHSQALSFAKEKTSEPGLHEVATVDSKAAGVTIHMFDYNNRDEIKSVTGSDEYGVGWLPPSHVESKLAGGYPVFTNGNSGSVLFAPDNDYCKGDGNHLFLESVFNATGYYEYSAFNNFAHYNDNGTFTVYQETGTPDTDTERFFFRRGNFLPFNELDPKKKQTQNLYAGDGTILDYENPDYGSTLYGIKGSTNYFFGMSMEFNFLIPKDGYDNGNPLVYEFNGDDDLWIFVDDVLILDIGGVHDAFPGTINFATGDITGGHGGAGGARTIKQCFQNAGVFPDGKPWDGTKVDQYFKGDTFISYGSHKFNMFYMEHGEGASNLQTRFNLPVIERGNVTVEKQLDHTSQVDYANVSFAYQAFAKDAHGDYQPLTSAVYEGTNTPVVFHNDVKFFGHDTDYDNVFYLKPGEAAVFSNMIEDELYYVQELGIDDKYYDQIFVNDVRIVGEQVIKVDGIYKSTEATARSRAKVTFTNHCDDRNTNELRITKRLADPSENNGDTFEFRVMLENASGVLSDYYQGTYYIRDDYGVYYRYEGGKLVSNGQTPYPCAAGNNGTIAHIPPNYTVVIMDLVAGTDFYVDEIRVRPNGSTSDVLLANSDWILQSRDVSDYDAAEIQNASIYDYASGTTITGAALGRIAWDKDAKVVFTNKLASVDVQLKKVREDGSTTISGSVFDLNKYRTSWTVVQTDIEPGKAAAGTTSAVPNPVDLGELGIGRYRLTETKAPDGYIILTKHIYFQVYRDTEDGVVKARLTDEAGTALDSPADMAAIDDPGTGDTPAYTITVKNTPGAVLPNTGGPGTLPYTLGGLMLIIASALMYGFRMRRKERRTN